MITLYRPERRWKCVGVCPEYVIGLMTTGAIFRCTAGFPEGCELIEKRYDEATNLIWLTVAHESFRDLEPDEEVPYLDCRMYRMNPDDLFELKWRLDE